MSALDLAKTSSRVIKPRSSHKLTILSFNFIDTDFVEFLKVLRFFLVILSHTDALSPSFLVLINYVSNTSPTYSHFTMKQIGVLFQYRVCHYIKYILFSLETLTWGFGIFYNSLIVKFNGTFVTLMVITMYIVLGRCRKFTEKLIYQEMFCWRYDTIFIK